MSVNRFDDGTFEFTDADRHPNCSDCGDEIKSGERAIVVEKEIRSKYGCLPPGRATTISHAGCGEGKYRFDSERKVWIG